MSSLYKKTAQIYNQLGERYLRSSQKVPPQKRAPFLKLLKPKAKILDVGCGGGRDAKFFVKKGLSVVGVDVSKVLINLAKNEVPKGKFIKEDLLKIKFKENTFDGIWAQAVLLHLKRKDVPKALKKFYQILKPGGVLHVAVRKGKGERFETDILSQGNERFYTYFSKKEIEELIKKEGFTLFNSEILPDQLKRKGIAWIVVWARK